MTPDTRAIPEELFRQVQGEFLEMPGLRLTQPQACRLWGLDRELCVLLLSRLVDDKFLTCTRDGRFMPLDRSQAKTVDPRSVTKQHEERNRPAKI